MSTALTSPEVSTAGASAHRAPRYQELVESISSQIRSGELVPGTRLPSFAEMREQQGVSQTTIVKVYARLEQDGLIRREPKRGIFVAKQERALTGQIGFVGTAFARRSQVPYAAHIVDGMEAVAAREGQRIVLLQRDAPIPADTVDGVLFNAASGAEQLLPAGLPSVALVNTIAGIPSVVADDFGGARMGVGRLISLGHRRIAALQQSFDALVHIRVAGYHSALHEAGITAQRDWLRDPGPMNNQSGYRAWGYENMKVWLRDGWHELGCTALFVQNDLTALGVLDALREADIRVPEEVSVLSFDGTEVCEYSWPSLAAVEVPLEQIATSGMELLLRMIRGEKVDPTITMLPAKWKVGASVAPPPPHRTHGSESLVKNVQKPEVAAV